MTEDLLKQILNPLRINPNKYRAHNPNKYRAHLTYDDKTYVAEEHESREWHCYSKSWHNQHGPKITVSDRKVYVIDHATLSCRLIARLERWPAASRTISFRGVTTKVSDGPLKAIVDRIPREDLPLLIGSQDPIVDTFIERRLKKGT